MVTCRSACSPWPARRWRRCGGATRSRPSRAGPLQVVVPLAVEPSIGQPAHEGPPLLVGEGQPHVRLAGLPYVDVVGRDGDLNVGTGAGIATPAPFKDRKSVV